MTDVKALKRHSMQNHAGRFLTCTQILPGIFRKSTGEPGEMKFTLTYIPEALRVHCLDTLKCGMGDILKIYGTNFIHADELSWPLTLQMFNDMCPSHPYFHGATMHASVLQKLKDQHDLKFLGRVQWNFSGIIRTTSLQDQSDPEAKFFKEQRGQLRDQLEAIGDVWVGISAPLVIPVLSDPAPEALQAQPPKEISEDTCSLFGGSQVGSLGSWHASQPPPEDADLFSNDPYP
jgi:hypothetical protein